MNELKCPFCQQELQEDFGYDGDYSCPNCRGYYFGSPELWQELIRTRKALDKAKWWLNEIVKNHRFTPISTAEKALKELNKKEEK